MSTTVYKYQLELERHLPREMVSFTFEAPASGKIIHFEHDFQKMVALVWLRVPKQNELPVKRTIEIYGTGWTIPDDKVRKHIATYRDGRFVWHVFEVVNEKPSDG